MQVIHCLIVVNNFIYQFIGMLKLQINFICNLNTLKQDDESSETNN